MELIKGRPDSTRSGSSASPNPGVPRSDRLPRRSSPRTNPPEFGNRPCRNSSKDFMLPPASTFAGANYLTKVAPLDLGFSARSHEIAHSVCR